MVIWQFIVKLTWVLVLSGLLATMIVVQLNFRLIAKKLKQIWLSHKKSIITFLVFLSLVLFIPTVLMLLNWVWYLSQLGINFALENKIASVFGMLNENSSNTAMSLLVGNTLFPRALGVYVRELLISIIIVLSFAVSFRATRKVQNLLKFILHQTRSLCSTIRRTVAFPKTDVDENAVIVLPVLLNDQLLVPSLDCALQAWDRGEISQEKVGKVQLLGSLFKWIEQEDKTGLSELQEEVRYGDGLDPEVRRVMESILQRLQQKHKTRARQIAKQLKSLLSAQPMVNTYAD